jgi:hypothetical protein
MNMNDITLIGYAVLVLGLAIGFWGWRTAKRRPAAGPSAQRGNQLERVGVIVVMVGLVLILALSLVLKT